MGLLDTLYAECEGVLDFRAIKDGKTKQKFIPYSNRQGIKSFLMAHADHDLYFAVATRDGKAGKKENIVNIPALHTDIDFKSVDELEVKKRLSSFPFSPTIRVLSGGGMHLYWKLREPSDASDIVRCEQIMKAIAVRLGGDMAATDASRILRIPNTKNYKYQPPRDVVLDYCNGKTYNLDDFEEFFPVDQEQDHPAQGACSHNSNPDLDIIMGCEFMAHCRDDAKTLPEVDWHAMISQLAGKPGGSDLIHKLSKPYPKYKQSQTKDKILYIMNSTGPWSCSTIRDKTGFRCKKDCGVKSPAALAYVKHVTGVTDVTGVTVVTSVTGCNQERKSCNRDVTRNAQNVTEVTGVTGVTEKVSAQNRKQLVMDWLETCDGIFTIQDVARELQFISIKDYNNLKLILKRLVDQNIIERAGNTRGVYQKIEAPIPDMDLWSDDATDPEFPIDLPLDVSDLAMVYPKNIIVIAGEKNSSKTAFALDIARRNMKSMDVTYFSSEMGIPELRSRVSAFENTRLEDWKKVHFKDKIYNLHHHLNPDGLNIIDFLEIHDEFWKIGGTIRQIYDRLKSGVAVICIQKKTGADFGRGGEATAEKARLYINLYNMKDPTGKPYNRAKLVYVKMPRDFRDHPGGMIRDFNIIGGWQFYPKGQWKREC